MSQQKLVYAIIEFLNKSLEDGTVKQDDKEGLEVASAPQIFIIGCDGKTDLRSLPQFNASVRLLALTLRTRASQKDSQSSPPHWNLSLICF